MLAFLNCLLLMNQSDILLGMKWLYLLYQTINTQVNLIDMKYIFLFEVGSNHLVRAIRMFQFFCKRVK
jgi:hypothetical protein